MRQWLKLLSLLILLVWLASSIAVGSRTSHRVRNRATPRSAAFIESRSIIRRHIVEGGQNHPTEHCRLRVATTESYGPLRLSVALNCQLWQGAEEGGTNDDDTSSLFGFDISNAKVIVFDKDGTLGSDKGTLQRWVSHMTQMLEERAKEVYCSRSTTTDASAVPWTVQSQVQNFHWRIGWDPINSEVLPSAPLAAGTWQDQVEQLQQILEDSQLDCPGGSLASTWHQSVELHGADDALIPDLAEMLNDCIIRGLLVAVCTSDERKSTDAALKYWNVDHLIPYSICADEVECPKPAAEPLERLCSHISQREGVMVSTGDCIVVGDTTGDTGMATNAKSLLCVGVLTGSGTEEILCSTGADIVLPSVAQIPALLSALGRHPVP